MVERNNGKTQFITMAGVIAAAYVVLTYGREYHYGDYAGKQENFGRYLLQIF